MTQGTGKTTVARIYAKLLFQLGLLKADKVIETTGTKLAAGREQGLKTMLDEIAKAGSGLLFVDEYVYILSNLATCHDI